MSARHHNAQLLRLKLRLALSAYAGRVDKTHCESVMLDDAVNRISSSSSCRRNHGALFPRQFVEECGFSNVRTADNGDTNFSFLLILFIYRRWYGNCNFVQ